MTEETRARMIATPCAQMPAELIAEYSNSAHGVPNNLDDLRALMPRYVELISLGEAVDYLEIGLELSRFGQARALHPDFMSQEQYLAYAHWGRCLMSAWPVGRNLISRNNSLLHTLEMLICGGVEADDLLWHLEDLLADQGTLGTFAKALLSDTKPDGTPDLYALEQSDKSNKAKMLNWLSGPRLGHLLADLATDPKAPFDHSEAARIAHDRLQSAAPG